MARKLQPGLLVVDRTAGGGCEDFLTPEGTHAMPNQFMPEAWEACMTLGDWWGWTKGSAYHSSGSVIRYLVKAVARNGNLLLDVGPDANGELDPQAVRDSQGNRRVAQDQRRGDLQHASGEAVRTRKCLLHRQGRRHGVCDRAQFTRWRADAAERCPARKPDRQRESDHPGRRRWHSAGFQARARSRIRPKSAFRPPAASRRPAPTPGC